MDAVGFAVGSIALFAIIIIANSVRIIREWERGVLLGLAGSIT